MSMFLIAAILISLPAGILFFYALKQAKLAPVTKQRIALAMAGVTALVMLNAWSAASPLDEGARGLGSSVIFIWSGPFVILSAMCTLVLTEFARSILAAMRLGRHGLSNAIIIPEHSNMDQNIAQALTHDDDSSKKIAGA